MQSDTLRKMWDLEREEREEAFDKSKFSEVNTQLTRIRNDLKSYKDLAKAIDFMLITNSEVDGSVH